MLSTPPSAEADRIALTKMFKAIAEYGRKVRLRRQAEYDKTVVEEPVQSEEEAVINKSAEKLSEGK